MSALALCPSMPASASRKPLAFSRWACWRSSSNCSSRIRVYNRYVAPNISPDSSSAPIDVVADVKTERIVVLGGTGFVGTAICKAAVSKGIEVVSVSRSGRPSYSDPWIDQVTWTAGDVFYVRWDELLVGATAVVSTLGGFGNEEQMKKINGEANILAVGAAKDYGVPKFVLISVHDYNLPSFLLSSGYFTGKRKAESEVLSKYPSSGVVLRPAFIYGKRKVNGFEIPLDLVGEPLERLLLSSERFIKPLSSLPGSDFLAPPVSVDDVAFAAINAVLDDDFFGVFTIEQIREAAAKLCYKPSVIVYTILLRTYGQVGKIRLAEKIFLEMLEAGCEPDEVACGTMLCAYARWGRQKPMMTFYSAVRRRDIFPSIAVFNFMMSSFHKQKIHTSVIYLWKQILEAGLEPNGFTYTLTIYSFIKKGLLEDALGTFRKMKNAGFIPEESTYSLLIILTAKHGREDEALRLYEEMKSQGIIPSIYTFASVLALHYKNDDYSKALSMFSQMERNKIVPDEVIYGLLVRIYGKLGLYEDAQRTFEDIKKLGLLTHEKTYVAMAQVHLNSGKYDKALDVLNLMRLRNVELSKFAYSAFLRCYIAKEDVGAAELTFQTLCRSASPDAICYNEMLIFYLKLGLLEKAKGLICQIRRYEVPIDGDLYRTVLEVYCRERMVTDAEHLVDQMQSLGLVVDNRSKMLLITLYGEVGELQLAEDLLKTFEQPDAASLGVMLCSYLKNGDICKASEMLKSLLETANGLSIASRLMTKLVREGCVVQTKWIYARSVELGFKLDDAAIASVINLYGQHQQLKEALEIYTLASRFTMIDKAVYTSMIETYCKCHKVNEADLLYKEMIEKGHAPDVVAISILVNAFSKHGMFQKAEWLIYGSFGTDIALDTVAYNTYIKAMLDSGKLHLAIDIYDRMIASGVPPSLQTYNTMISVYGQGGKLSRAIDMFNAALDLGPSIDEKAYTNMISYYGKWGRIQDASLLFNKMREGGIKPGKISYNTMINAYATAGLHNEAENILKDMERDGHSPDSLSYLALIRAYTQSHKHCDAEKVLSRMKEAQILPSCAHFNHIIFAFAREGCIGDAERVFNLMKQTGLNPDLACCRTMIRTYMDYELVNEGLFLFESTNGLIKSDGFILSAAVHLYEYVGKSAEAWKILDAINLEGLLFLRNLEVGSKLRR